MNIISKIDNIENLSTESLEELSLGALREAVLMLLDAKSYSSNDVFNFTNKLKMIDDELQRRREI